MTPPCRLCGVPLEHTFVDLGASPLANAYLTPAGLFEPETFYPLHVFICDRCWLAQLPEVASPASIFGDYAYFSSFSDSWLHHAERYVETTIAALGLDAGSKVVEIASNDGYLLQYFAQRGVPVLGVEPAANVAAAAIDKGIPTEIAFLGEESARRLVARHGNADLLVGNNVLAHVPKLHDFVAGLAVLLAPDGLLTMEFPHLLRLIEEGQFDTIYHEHYSYLSLIAVTRAFAEHGLTVVDVEELATHGGSLRVHARHAGSRPPVSPRVIELQQREEERGLRDLATYQAFASRVATVKRALLRFLLEAREAGKQVVAYGAPAKGNTLLNACGIRSDLLAFTVDRSPHKQGCYLPGTRLPIRAPQTIFDERPDFVLILPWNLRTEIATQMAGIREWGGRFVVPIPELEVF